MRRSAALLAVVCVALAAGAIPAGATNECRGLLVCVPVAGPWVLVPTGRGVARPRVEYQLSCPRRYIVGGLDAQLSDRGIDVTFLGKLGSPVNPGITTSRSAVFVGAYVRGSARAPTFRPHIGCMPASGGGRVPTSAVAFPPGEPTIRRVRTVRLRPGRTQRVRQGCAADERLVRGSHAVGFFMRTPPGESLASAVTAAQAVRAGRVAVSVRTEPALRAVRAVVQVQAVCARGRGR